MKKQAFCLWSGGKDSHLALMKVINEGYDVVLLLTFFDATTRLSLSHRLPARLLRDQAALTGIYMQEVYVSREEYEQRLRGIMLSLAPQGINHAVFGDIYLEEHKAWNERVCSACSVTPVFPLWGASVESVVEEQRSFTSIVVSVEKEKLDRQWLGREFDKTFKQALADRGLDFCGEKGEYHTFVVHSPLMKGRLQLQGWKEQSYDSYIGLDILDWSVFHEVSQEAHHVGA